MFRVHFSLRRKQGLDEGPCWPLGVGGEWPCDEHPSLPTGMPRNSIQSPDVLPGEFLHRGKLPLDRCLSLELIKL